MQNGLHFWRPFLYVVFELAPSRASLLPHGIYVSLKIPCGSGLARDGGAAVLIRYASRDH